MFNAGLLDLIDDDTKAELLRGGVVRQYPRRSFVVHEGDESSLVLVVQSGLLKIVKALPSGRSVMIGLRGPGAVLGELAAFGGDGGRSATITTVTAAEITIVSGAKFVALVDSRPDVAQAMVRVLVNRLRTVNDHLVELGTADSVARVAARLVELVDDESLFAIVKAERTEGEGELSLELPISQEEFGEWTGQSREAVVKALRKLKDRGMIDSYRRTILIKDLDALRNRAGVNSLMH